MAGDAHGLSSEQLLIALQKARAKLEAADRAEAEPIAIVGMSCRFPGDVTDPDAFWRVLHEGVDAVGPIPPDRWDADAFYDPNPGVAGKSVMRDAALLAAVDEFDCRFFGISPREAANLDPQHRLLLEVGWEAFEDAGVPPERLNGSRTGVFVGIGQNDYSRLQSDISEINAHTGTGNGLCYAPGRLSYVLGLRGPSVAIDTACSSSLVAVHYGCRSLRSRECDMAIAGGVHLILSPEVGIVLSMTRALSPDGRCKAFSADANGFGRGEGCGVVVLKRLSDALAADDRVLAVVRGSAVNHDGAGAGFTVPSVEAQAEVIREAQRNARIAPGDIDYIEAHGTGTELGDPIEIQALSMAFGQDRPDASPLIVGSVKSNIGHLEAAAGVAGLIKVVLALQNEEIPAHLHFSRPSPHIPWDQLAIKVAAERQAWPRRQRPRAAGIS
jgi:acyl transferase domain-containing protein